MENQIAISGQVDLYRASSHKFLEFCEPLLGKAVAYFERRRLFSREDASDAHQEARLRLLERADQIIDQYAGRAAFANYISTVIMNHFRVMLRNNRMREFGPCQLDRLPDMTSEPIPRKLLQDEFRKLDGFFTLLKGKRPRLILCLKLLYRIPLLKEDIVECLPEASDSEIFALLDLNRYQNVKLKDKDLFAFLTPILSRHAGKRNTPDALRRWVDLKTWEMICYMNGDPPEAGYNRESIQILVEKYFMEFKNNRLFSMPVLN